MRGALPPLLIVWCIGTGKHEVPRHDFNEYSGLSFYTRTYPRVEIFASTFKACLLLREL